MEHHAEHCSKRDTSTFSSYQIGLDDSHLSKEDKSNLPHCQVRSYLHFGVSPKRVVKVEQCPAGRQSLRIHCRAAILPEFRSVRAVGFCPTMRSSATSSDTRRGITLSGKALAEVITFTQDTDQIDNRGEHVARLKIAVLASRREFMGEAGSRGLSQVDRLSAT